MSEHPDNYATETNPRQYLWWLGLLAVLGIFAWLCWMASSDVVHTKKTPHPPATYIGEIRLPEGWTRTPQSPDSFGAWLRQLPLKSPEARIRLFDGRRKLWQHALYQVVDLPIGDKDLQQCADVAIRLRSDYLRSRGRTDEIAFNFTSGDRARYTDWVRGMRPVVNGNSVTWNTSAPPDSSHAGYRQYLNTVFTYAGSYSLSKELPRVGDIGRVSPGDCFIKGGFPGHVIMVADVAVDTASGDKLVMLMQGALPAQDIHVIRNYRNDELNPWFRVGEGQYLMAAGWIFNWTELHRFH